MAAPFESGFLSEREHVIGQLERGTVITKFYGKKVSHDQNTVRVQIPNVFGF